MSKSTWALRGCPAPWSGDSSCQHLTKAQRMGRDAHPPVCGFAAVTWCSAVVLLEPRGADGGSTLSLGLFPLTASLGGEDPAGISVGWVCIWDPTPVQPLGFS